MNNFLMLNGLLMMLMILFLFLKYSLFIVVFLGKVGGGYFWVLVLLFLGLNLYREFFKFLEIMRYGLEYCKKGG